MDLEYLCTVMMDTNASPDGKTNDGKLYVKFGLGNTRGYRLLSNPVTQWAGIAATQVEAPN